VCVCVCVMDSNTTRKDEALETKIPSVNEYEVQIKENDTPQ
jgi:hypothetical protein